MPHITKFESFRISVIHALHTLYLFYSESLFLLSFLLGRCLSMYLHNIYVKIEIHGKLKPSAHSASRAANVKFILRVLAVVAA